MGEFILTHFSINQNIGPCPKYNRAEMTGWRVEDFYAFPTVFLSKNRNLSVYKGGRVWILTPEWFFLFNKLMCFKIGDHKNNSSIWDNFFSLLD